MISAISSETQTTIPTVRALSRMTQTTRKTAIAALQLAQEELFDADELLAGVRISKETADRLCEMMAKLKEVDRLITVAVDNIV